MQPTTDTPPLAVPKGIVSEPSLIQLTESNYLIQMGQQALTGAMNAKAFAKEDWVKGNKKKANLLTSIFTRFNSIRNDCRLMVAPKDRHRFENSAIDEERTLCASAVAVVMNCVNIERSQAIEHFAGSIYADYVRETEPEIAADPNYEPSLHFMLSKLPEHTRKQLEAHIKSHYNAYRLNRGQDKAA